MRLISGRDEQLAVEETLNGGTRKAKVPKMKLALGNDLLGTEQRLQILLNPFCQQRMAVRIRAPEVMPPLSLIARRLLYIDFFALDWEKRPWIIFSASKCNEQENC
jgi:hypothetical protein